MLSDFTLLIPTYNRPTYLERILKYYQFSGIKILVADSSVSPYNIGEDFSDVTYLHVPDEKLPRKMAIALKHISTKYMAICADDDFTIPDGIETCINFLEANKDFAAAQGNTLSYRKDKAAAGKLSFSVLYKNNLSFTINQQHPFDRAQRLFQPYRTIFTAVHYTKNLRLAYNDTITIDNLFLNEYLSGIIPVLMGKYIELPVFFQVREYASNSGDKVTDNIDVMIKSEKYKAEYDQYISYTAIIAANEKIEEQQKAEEKLKNIFGDFAAAIVSDRKKTEQSFAEKMMDTIVHLPSIVSKAFAKLKRGAVVNLVVKTVQDKKNFAKVAALINEYSAKTND